MVRSQVPRFFLLEVHGNNYSEQLVYASDLTSCENVTAMCNEFSVENNVVDLVIPNMSQVCAQPLVVYVSHQITELDCFISAAYHKYFLDS